MHKVTQVQQALGGSSSQAMFYFVAVLGKITGKPNQALRTQCYPISADAASARGRHIPGITK